MLKDQMLRVPFSTPSFNAGAMQNDNREADDDYRLTKKRCQVGQGGPSPNAYFWEKVVELVKSQILVQVGLWMRLRCWYIDGRG